MLYSKPSLQSHPAMLAIQSGGQSKQINNVESDPSKHTTAAYEADE